MSREADPYLRLIWLFDSEFGWRPSHSCAMRWGDVQYDEGHPYAIIANGENGEFKTYSPVVAWLPPDVVKALEEWKAIHPSPISEALILPFRSITGKVEARKHMNTLEYERKWLKLQKKYALPKLRPKDLRHWIATKARLAGMSENARAYLQGHDPTSFNPSMGTLYDNESREKALDEQARLFPNGTLALLMPAQVEILDDLPSEAVSLLKQFMAGELDSYEFMPQLMTLRKQLDKVKLARMGV